MYPSSFLPACLPPPNAPSSFPLRLPSFSCPSFLSLPFFFAFLPSFLPSFPFLPSFLPSFSSFLHSQLAIEERKCLQSIESEFVVNLMYVPFPSPSFLPSFPVRRGKLFFARPFLPPSHPSFLPQSSFILLPCFFVCLFVCFIFPVLPSFLVSFLFLPPFISLRTLIYAFLPPLFRPSSSFLLFLCLLLSPLLTFDLQICSPRHHTKSPS